MLEVKKLQQSVSSEDTSSGEGHYQINDDMFWDYLKNYGQETALGFTKKMSYKTKEGNEIVLYAKTVKTGKIED